jgi:hypothetical protein
VSDGLANNVDFEPTISANMRGLEPTLFANEPRFRLLAIFDTDVKKARAYFHSWW